MLRSFVSSGLLLFLFVLVGPKEAFADERLWVDVRLNGKPAHFLLDTGAGVPFGIFREAAERLAIRLAPVRVGQELNREINDGKRKRLPETELCDLNLWGSAQSTTLWVLDDPFDDADGVVGWYTVAESLLLIDALDLTVNFPPTPPPLEEGWTACQLDTNANVLMLEVPKNGGGMVRIFVDTGAETGIELPPDSWREWTRQTAEVPRTLRKHYSGIAGDSIVAEEGWARTFSIGTLSLTDVPIMEGLPKKELTLGLAALKRVDFVLDGKRHRVLLRPRTTPPPPFYEHNRLGAVFVENKSSGEMIARVLPNTPAWEGGIRPGQVLLKVGDLDVSGWYTNRSVPAANWYRPSGTRVDLTLKAGQTTNRVSITLREILSPLTK